jgi:hypothetical protein
MVAEADTGGAQRHDLGVRSRIGISDIAIAPAAYDFIIEDDDGTDRNLASVERPLSFAESFLHP